MKVDSAILHIVDGDIELMIRDLEGHDTIISGDEALVAFKSLKTIKIKGDAKCKFGIVYTPKGKHNEERQY